MKRKARRVALIFLALVCLASAVPAVLTWRMVRQERLNRALIEAAKRADDKAAIRLLEQGADPNCREKTAVPASPWRMLLDVMQGKRINTGPDEMTPLAYASGGHVVHVRNTFRLPSGRQVTIQMPCDDYQPDPENTALVRVLLAHGADIDALAGHLLASIPRTTPGDYATALDYAIYWRRWATAQMLLAQGAKVSGSHSGNLVYFAKDNPRLLASLLAYGADINARTVLEQRTNTPDACLFVLQCECGKDAAGPSCGREPEGHEGRDGDGDCTEAQPPRRHARA